MIRQLPIKEAAEILGVSEITVRRRIKSNELLAIKSETPQGYRWLVVIEDDAGDEREQLTYSVGDQPPTHKAESPGQLPNRHPDTDRLIQSLEERLAFAEEQVRFMQSQLHERTRETEQLHVLLAQAMQALPSGQAPTQAADQ